MPYPLYIGKVFHKNLKECWCFHQLEIQPLTVFHIDQMDNKYEISKVYSQGWF